MKQLLLKRAVTPDGNYRLDDKEKHYLLQVLRRRDGDEILCLHEKVRYRCRLPVKDNDAELAVEERMENRGNSCHRPRIFLLQCLPKNKKMDLIVRQAVEAGIEEVFPLESAYSQVKYKNEQKTAKRERWEKIAREAVQQSGRVNMPVIHPVTTLEAVAGQLEDCVVKLFFHEKPLANIPLHDYLSESPERIAVVIGPEGGLADSECKLLQSRGFDPAYLGSNVLRCETAALFALAAIQIICLETEAWQSKN